MRSETKSPNHLRLSKAMTRRFLFLFFLIGTTQTIIAQTITDFLPIKVNYKWGIINLEGDTILTPKYDFIGFFDKFNYAPIRLNHKTGLISHEGKIIVQPNYQVVQAISQHFFIIGFDDKQKGVQNQNQQLIISPNYEEVKLVNNQYFQVKKDAKLGIFDLSGKQILTPNFDKVSIRKFENIAFFEVERNQKVGLYSLKGKQILPTSFQKLEIVAENTILAQNENQIWEIRELQNGTKTTTENWKNFDKKNTNFLVLESINKTNKKSLYFLVSNKLVTKGEYDSFLFSETFSSYIITQLADKFGLISINGHQILEAKYDELADLNQGFIAYKKENRWGMIHQNGKRIFAPKFDEIMPFPNNSPVTKIRLSRSYGLINRSGKLLAEVDYRNIEVYAQKAKCYRLNQMTLVDFDKNGNWTDSITFRNYKTLHITGELSSDVARIFRDSVRILTVRQGNEMASATGSGRGFGWRRRTDGAYYFTNPQGRPVRGENQVTFYDRYREDTIRSFSVAWHQKSQQSYILNKRGEVKKALPIYDINLRDWRESTHARAILDDLSSPTGKIQAITAAGYGMYVFVTNRGNLISTLPVKSKALTKTKRTQYQRISFIGDFEDGLARVNLTGKLQPYISEEIIARDSVYDVKSEAVFFPNDKKMRVSGGKWGFVNRSGTLIIQPEYDFVRNFYHGKAIAKLDNKWGVIDKKNQIVIPFIYDFIDYMPESDKRFFILTNDSKRVGYVHENGRVLLEPDFEEVGKMSENMIRVKKNGIWGFIHSINFQKIDFQFIKAKDFHENLASVAVMTEQKKLLWGFIDKAGNWVIKPQFSRAGSFHHGLAKVQINRKYGFIDKTGNI